MKFLIFTLAMIVSVTAFSAEFKVSIPSAANGKFGNEQVLNGFGCTGDNISPEIIWENPPSGTKSFALTVYDPDAPTGSGWWHWVVTDIPENARSFAKGAGSGKAALPEGSVQSGTDFGKPGWGGPCPPAGTNHRYVVTVTALKVDKLGIAPSATAALAGFMININSIAKATAVIMYGR